MGFDCEVDRSVHEKYDPERDYQIFLEWYEENETWLEGCHTERQAFYACWEAARERGRLYELRERDGHNQR